MSDLIHRADVEKMLREKYRKVCSSLDPYDLELPDYKNNPTLSVRELLSELSSIQSVDGWVTVTEKLPPYTGKYPEEYVIVFNWIAVYESKFSGGKFYHVWNYELEYEDTNVTHWMPLPPNPTSHVYNPTNTI